MVVAVARARDSTRTASDVSVEHATNDACRDPIAGRDDNLARVRSQTNRAPVGVSMRRPSIGTLVLSSSPLIVGASEAMRTLLHEAARAAQSDAKVLVTGESGVGKDLLARHIHLHSVRARHPIRALNCAGVPETLLESELFGHVRGSFTGAYRDKPGLLAQADGGTLFLDEVGEMSLRMQALLLRFLETGEIQPVGANGFAARVDVRLIAATNRNLGDLVAQGQFREDLLYRMRVIHFYVPALRERPEDIRPLVDFLLTRLPRRVRFTEAAMAALEAYRWPGNVRELQNVIEQTFWVSEGDVLDVQHLPAAMQGGVSPNGPGRDRRRQVADQLFEQLAAGQISFWGDVHRRFLLRDLTRDDIRGLVQRGLTATHGSYRALLPLLHLGADDYKKFLNFLRTHDCSVSVQPFRQASMKLVRSGHASPFARSALAGGPSSRPS
jgi:DNA-binding NtrC family response regulator